MTIKPAIILALSVLAGCASSPVDKITKAPARSDPVKTAPSTTSRAHTLATYKYDLAQRIVEVNSTKVYTSRPQALLRSVIVVKYTIDAGGNLVRSEIFRSNRDSANETTALASLRNAAPFPKPASHLLQRGRVEVMETWLFNNDGRFQLRTIAQPQMNE
jgi:protein TonB